jgi:putative transposase
VDQAGTVRDMVGQRQRDKRAATQFFRKLLQGLTYVPRVIITDQLTSSGAAKRASLPGGEHCQPHSRKNRAENAQQPTGQRERRMHRCQSSGHAQRFLATYGLIAAHFRPCRHGSALHIMLFLVYLI